MDLTLLKKSFHYRDIDWRIGRVTDEIKGIASVLAYIDVRALYQKFDDACGVNGWQITYPHVGQKTCCEISVLIGDRWVTKSNGAGDTAVEGDKGAFSDAAKRAGVPWGVGRYLYDMPDIKVSVKKVGRNYYIEKEEYPKLNKLATMMGKLNDLETIQQFNDIVPELKEYKETLDWNTKYQFEQYGAKVKELLGGKLI